MSTELAKQDEAATDLVLAQRDELDKILSSEVDPDEVGFLKSIRFYSARASACQTGEREVNTFCVDNEGQFERDLGKEIPEMVFITKRQKAVYTTKDGYGTTFDPESDGWKIAVEQEAMNNSQAQAEQSKLGQQKFPRMYGDEWLVYVPSVDDFFLWYYGTGKTMRKDSMKSGDGRRGITFKVSHRMCDHSSGPYATPRYTRLDDDEQFDVVQDLRPKRVMNALKRFKEDAKEFVPRAQNEGVSNDDDEV